MKFGDKDFKFYWPIIKVPFYILLAWTFAAIIIGKISISLYFSIFSGYASLLLQVAVYAFIGYSVIADHKGTPGISMWSGIITGVLLGLIGGVLGIFTPFLAPELIDASVEQAVSQGAPEDTVRTWIQISSYIGVLIGPIIGAIFGAIVSGISGVISNKMINKKK